MLIPLLEPAAAAAAAAATAAVESSFAFSFSLFSFSEEGCFAVSLLFPLPMLLLPLLKTCVTLSMTEPLMMMPILEADALKPPPPPEPESPKRRAKKLLSNTFLYL